jgi:3-hydroxybutyryl-CoA dehydrogenase
MAAAPKRRLLVVGGGTMGLQVAAQAAAHGLPVVVHDSAADALAAGPARLAVTAAALVAAAGPAATGGAAPDGAGPDVATIVGRVAFEGDLARAADGVDIVSESIPEDPGLKSALFRRLHDLAPASAIFTTNTSTLVPSQMAGRDGRPARFAALHFHQPVWSARVVDVMGHPGTDAAVLDELVAFARGIGLIPIRLGTEHHGYVFNAMFNALNREAITLAAKGVAGVEDVDRAWMEIMKMPIGPFGILDMVGIDTAWHITAYWAKRMPWDRQLGRNARFLRAWVDRGDLGTKTGRGFYVYPDPAYARPGFVDALVGVSPAGVSSAAAIAATAEGSPAATASPAAPAAPSGVGDGE